MNSQDLRRFCLLLIATLSLVGCGTKAPRPPPDTPSAKLRTIAYLPLYGARLDPFLQDELSARWDKWWNEVYPGTNWVNATGTSQRLQRSKAYEAWQAAEQNYLQSGLLSAEVASAICDAVSADGFVQTAVYSVQLGSGSRLGSDAPKALNTPSSARMTYITYDCGTKQAVGRAASEVRFDSGSTQPELVRAVHRRLAGWIGYDAKP
jgi:hypothetical protein